VRQREYPALTDALAQERELILFDYAGVGSTTGALLEEPAYLKPRDLRKAPIFFR